MRGVILVSLENASFHMVHVYTINWFKKVQNINYEYIIFGQIIFQNFHQFKAFVGLSDYRTVGL